ncbi:hypothetical protein HanIR_Chr11g0529441 [Helianthus annuus]|nr:hypothetical protein HanIR_Chr11g0529441 [Helianthus annuus]
MRRMSGGPETPGSFNKAETTTSLKPDLSYHESNNRKGLGPKFANSVFKIIGLWSERNDETASTHASGQELKNPVLTRNLSSLLCFLPFDDEKVNFLPLILYSISPASKMKPLKLEAQSALKEQFFLSSRYLTALKSPVKTHSPFQPNIT